MRVLITGASGFVGRWLAAELLAAGDEVFGLDRAGEDGPPGVTSLAADICDAEAVAAAVRQAAPEALYHLAAISSGAAADRERVLQVNVGGTRALLAAAGRLGRPVRVFLAGTGYVYGNCDPLAPAAEESPLRPIGFYAQSKWMMERAAQEYGPPVEIVIARAFNHTGPGQRTEFVVPAFASQIAQAERAGSDAVIRVGDLSPLRDFMDVRDVVRAYRLIVEKGEPGGVYNVASGTAHSIEEVLDLLRAQARVPVRVLPDPARLRRSEIRASVGSAGKLERLTGWRPTIPLKQTLSDTLEWWRSMGQ